LNIFLSINVQKFIQINLLILIIFFSVVNQNNHKNCRIQLLVVVIFASWNKIEKVMMMMQYTYCVVKAHKLLN